MGIKPGEGLRTVHALGVGALLGFVMLALAKRPPQNLTPGAPSGSSSSAPGRGVRHRLLVAPRSAPRSTT
jgi:hypothetical protein